VQKYAFPNKKQVKSIPENDYLGLISTLMANQQIFC